MVDYIRVAWRRTGHESTIPAHRFDPMRHRKTEKPAVDRNGSPLPPKFHTTVDGEAAKRRKPATPADSSTHLVEGAVAQRDPQATIETEETD